YGRIGRGSDRPDVLRLFSLAAGCDFELDALTLLQRPETRALNVRIVHEDVIALLARNETKALLRVEELHRTCDQLLLFSSDEQARVAPSGSFDPTGRGA